MSPAWTLAAVALGAVLGAVAQGIAAWLADRWTHRRWLREQKVDIYQAVLEQTDQVLDALNRATTWRRHDEGPFDYDFIGGLEPHMTALELFGDSKVAKAGDRVASAFNDLADEMPHEVDTAQIQKARDAYLAAVRADLGMK